MRLPRGMRAAIQRVTIALLRRMHAAGEVRMDIFEAMYTQRSMRYLKPDPIPDEVLAKVLESATQATSPSNMQPWRFVVVRDPQVKRRLSAYYLDSYEQIPRQEPDQRTAISKGVEYLARHLEEV